MQQSIRREAIIPNNSLTLQNTLLILMKEKENERKFLPYVRSTCKLSIRFIVEHTVGLVDQIPTVRATTTSYY